MYVLRLIWTWTRKTKTDVAWDEAMTKCWNSYSFKFWLLSQGVFHIEQVSYFWSDLVKMATSVVHKVRGAGGPYPSPTPFQFLADQLALFQPFGADYAYHITTGPPDFWTFHRFWKLIMYSSLIQRVWKLSSSQSQVCHSWLWK